MKKYKINPNFVENKFYNLSIYLKNNNIELKKYYNDFHNKNNWNIMKIKHTQHELFNCFNYFINENYKNNFEKLFTESIEYYLLFNDEIFNIKSNDKKMDNKIKELYNNINELNYNDIISIIGKFIKKNVLLLFDDSYKLYNSSNNYLIDDVEYVDYYENIILYFDSKNYYILIGEDDSDYDETIKNILLK